jgi:hypothetical protein
MDLTRELLEIHHGTFEMSFKSNDEYSVLVGSLPIEFHQPFRLEILVNERQERKKRSL